VIQSPSTPPVRTLPSTAPLDQQAAGRTATGPAKSTASGKSVPAPSSKTPFADENPDNVFTVIGDGPLVEIGSANEAAAVDRVTLGDFPDGIDSTLLVIDALPASAPVVANAKSSPVPLPAGFVEVPAYGYSPQGWPLRIFGEKTGVLMALVPGGAAKIGSQNGPSETQPEFQPFLDPFYMDINEVTLGQYQKFRADLKDRKNSRVQSPINDGQPDDVPALGLPWGIAQGFVSWAGKELPTEAEFEFATRGPDGWRTPWGDGRAIWPTPRAVDLIGPVQSFPTDQSQFGIFDLAGNAREWCNDFYAETAHRDAAAARPKLLRNWAGPKKGSSVGLRVVKGNGPDWAAWHRQGRVMNDRHPDVGFRGILRIRTAATSDSSGS